MGAAEQNQLCRERQKCSAPRVSTGFFSTRQMPMALVPDELSAATLPSARWGTEYPAAEFHSA